MHFFDPKYCVSHIAQMDVAAARFGFEGALVTCGKVVNQDGSLGLAHTTAGAAGVGVFFAL